MTRHLRTLAAVGALLVAVPAPGGAQPAVKCHDEVRHGAGSAVRFNVSAQSIDCWFDHLRGTQYAYLVLPKTPGGPILTLQPPGIRGTFG